MRRILFFAFLAATALNAQQAVTIGPAVFSGSGLNDATSGGAFTTVAGNHSYTVTISATGTPDAFTVAKDGGSASSSVNITGAAQALYYPVGSVASASWSAGRITYTTSAAHGLSTGAAVTVTGASPTHYNVAGCTILVIDTTHFSCPEAVSAGSWTSGGTVTATDGVTIIFAAITGHTAGDIWTVAATANGTASTMTTVAPGVGAKIARLQQEKNNDVVNVKDYGAKCDGGVTDDRAAVQAAINAVGGGTLVVCPATGPGAGIGAPGLYLWQANYGMTLTAGSASQGKRATYTPGSGGGFVAYAADPPTAILTDYAQNAHVSGILFDCNDWSATYGAEIVFGYRSDWTNDTAEYCSGDGIRADIYDTPVVPIVSGGGAGSSSITVGTLTNGGIAFGTPECDIIVSDVGLSTQEAHAITSTSGDTVVNISGTLANTQTDVQCSGNDNDIRMDSFEGIINDGWGLNLRPGSDINAWNISAPSFTGNTSGGELIHGAAHIQTGGNFQGDSGPAIQLGDNTSVLNTLVAGMVVSQLGDMEEATGSGGVNAVVAVCDDGSRVDTQELSRLVIEPGSGSCPDYSTYGSGTLGIAAGTDQNGYPTMFVKNTFGTFALSIYNSNQSGVCEYPGMMIMVPDATSLSALYQYCLPGAASAITAATNANPAVLTMSACPATGYARISGFSGAWEQANAIWYVTKLTSTTCSIPLNSSAFGTVTGTPVLATSSWTSPSASPTSLSPLTVYDAAAPGGSTPTATLNLDAQNSSSAEVHYAQIAGCNVTNTAGAENGCILFYTMQGGTLTKQLEIPANGALLFPHTYTVGTLPYCGGSPGQLAWATDILDTSHMGHGVLAGGGSVEAFVECDGTNWGIPSPAASGVTASGTLTSGQLIVGAGTSVVQTGNLSGAVTTSGSGVTAFGASPVFPSALTVYDPAAPGGSTPTATLNLDAQNSSSAEVHYAQIAGCSVTNTAGSENGCIFFYTMQAGTLTKQFEMQDNGTFWFLHAYTVGTLPSCGGSPNQIAIVTDVLDVNHLAHGVLSGGGSTAAVVECNGSNWGDAAAATATGVTAGTYGNSSNVPEITVNAQGYITSATTAAVAVTGGTSTETCTSGQHLQSVSVTVSPTGVPSVTGTCN